MFMIFKGKTPAGNKKYSTYELARSRVRQLIRKTFYSGQRQPSIGLFGFSVKGV